MGHFRIDEFLLTSNTPTPDKGEEAQDWRQFPSSCMTLLDRNGSYPSTAAFLSIDWRLNHAEDRLYPAVALSRVTLVVHIVPLVLNVYPYFIQQVFYYFAKNVKPVLGVSSGRERSQESQWGMYKGRAAPRKRTMKLVSLKISAGVILMNFLDVSGKERLFLRCQQTYLSYNALSPRVWNDGAHASSSRGAGNMEWRPEPSAELVANLDGLSFGFESEGNIEEILPETGFQIVGGIYRVMTVSFLATKPICQKLMPKPLSAITGYPRAQLCVHRDSCSSCRRDCRLRRYHFRSEFGGRVQKNDHTR